MHSRISRRRKHFHLANWHDGIISSARWNHCEWNYISINAPAKHDRDYAIIFSEDYAQYWYFNHLYWHFVSTSGDSHHRERKSCEPACKDESSDESPWRKQMAQLLLFTRKVLWDVVARHPNRSVYQIARDTCHLSGVAACLLTRLQNDESSKLRMAAETESLISNVKLSGDLFC